MPSTNRIKCPECGAEIDVSEVLYHDIEEKLKAQIAQKDAEHQKEIAALKKENAQAEERIRDEKDRELKQYIKKEEEKLRKQLAEENEEAMKTMQKSLDEKSAQVKEFNKTKVELENIKREKDELADKIAAEKAKEYSRALEEATIKIKKDADEANTLKIAEMQKVIEDQKKLVDEMKRKAEQGSMQTQGEVQELAIEDILKSTFLYDKIEPVPKGVNGADVIQRVFNNSGEEAGIIAYESKRTKAFSKDWIKKLKSDGALVKADICVLITETLPPDMEERIGQREGVWICTFNEFKSLALVLRDSIVKVSEAYTSQTNKGEKMQMLYDYLTGKEFSAQFMAILEGFNDLQKGYTEEKQRMTKIWATREKQLEKVMLNANSFIGSIKGIAGSSFQDIKEIEDTRNLLEINV
ncbi:MAG: DUF2130 domain-containing protein [Spirochaetaceae bacterium]|jgi:hypothetical protein|nr:DUF2130 domain-containing protein [Spirochaetaceae bacterium]